MSVWAMACGGKPGIWHPEQDRWPSQQPGQVIMFSIRQAPITRATSNASPITIYICSSIPSPITMNISGSIPSPITMFISCSIPNPITFYISNSIPSPITNAISISIAITNCTHSPNSMSFDTPMSSPPTPAWLCWQGRQRTCRCGTASIYATRRGIANSSRSWLEKEF